MHATTAPLPLPVQPLAYSLPFQRGRPGLVTAMAVMSIVVASLSLLFSLYAGIQALGMGMLSKIAMPAAATTTTTSTMSGSGSVVISTSVSSSGWFTASSRAATTAPAMLPSTAPAPTPASALTPAEVKQVIAKVQGNLGSAKLNAAQLATLTTALQDPSQQLVVPGTAWSPVTSTSMQPDGSALISLSGGYIQVDAKGVGSPFSNAGSMAGFSKISIVPCLVVAFESLASLGLAVLLLVAGIMTLRFSTRSPRLHRIYAWAKIPLAILGGVAFAWMMNQLMTSFGGPAAAMTGANAMFDVYGGVMATIACAYPIALLILLRTRTVRNYYNSIAEANG